MGCLRLHLTCLLAVLLLSTGVQASDNLSVKRRDHPFVQTHPAGTFFSYEGRTILLPGATFPDSLLNSLLLAGSDVIYRKLMNYFLQLTLEHTAQYFSEQNLVWYIYKGVPYTLQAWNLTFNILPKAFNIAAHGWERTLTTIGWNRRGRMPVFAGGALDTAVFIDVLLNTRENHNNHLKQLEFTPLQHVNTDQLTSFWQKSLGRMINSALINGVDSIRVTAQSSGDTRLEWHLKTGQWITADSFYPYRQQGQEYLTNWLDTSWNTPAPQGGLFTMLDSAGLDCITTRFTDPHTQCAPLQEMTQLSGTPTSSSFAIQNDAGEPASYLHLLNNRSLVPGVPGELLISDKPTLLEQDHRTSSTQYRIPKELAYLAEYMIYKVLYKVMDSTIGEGIEYANAAWHKKDDYTVMENVDGLRIPNSVQRVQTPDGRVFIKKSSPMIIPEAEINSAANRYAYLTREAAILNDIDGRGAVKLHDTWLENAGSPDAKIVLMIEDGGQDLSRLKPESSAAIKHLVRESTQAVAKVHEAGYIHFDIKPENLVVNSDGHVKLIDFEMAGKLTPKKPTIPLLFDHKWRAPEMEIGKPSTWRTDIWNLGATALSLFARSTLPQAAEIPGDVTGRKPEGPGLIETAKLIEEGQRLRSMPGFSSFLKQTLAEDPYARRSAQKLITHSYLN